MAKATGHDPPPPPPPKVFDYGVNWTEVKDVALPLLHKFTAHTNGSNIKMRDSGLAWSYYSTDPEWGQMQAKQLHAELEVSSRNDRACVGRQAAAGNVELLCTMRGDEWKNYGLVAVDDMIPNYSTDPGVRLMQLRQR